MSNAANSMSHSVGADYFELKKLLGQRIKVVTHTAKREWPFVNHAINLHSGDGQIE